MASKVSRAVQKLSNPFRRRGLAIARASGVGPKVFANSIPKSGTHLLMRCLQGLPGMVCYHAGVYFMRRQDPGWESRRASLLSMGKGCYISVHVPYEERFCEQLQDRDFKTILMIRDPRDLAVSHFHFATSRKRHPDHEYYVALPDNSTRLMTSIIGHESIGAIGAGNQLARFLLWHERGSLLVRFEDLIGTRGGGTQELQLQTVQRIADHLELFIDEAMRKRIAENMFSSKSNTFRKGVTGEWRKYFTDEHKKAFKDVAGQYLIDLGYEKDLDW